jgi:hypothetical protein
LRVIQLGQVWRRESLGHLSSQNLGFDFVSKQFVVLSKCQSYTFSSLT